MEDNILTRTSIMSKELDALTDGYNVVAINGKKIEICTNYSVENFKFPSGAFIYHKDNPEKLILCVGTGTSPKPKVTPKTHLWVLQEGDEGITPLPLKDLEHYIQQPLKGNKKAA